MPQASLHALVGAYQTQIDWLLTQAAEFESGERKVVAKMRGKEIDLSPNIAAEYRHKAGNMQAILQAYERLHAKENGPLLVSVLPSKLAPENTAT
jgi:hypothetical protein